MRIPRASLPETKAGFGGESRDGKVHSMGWESKPCWGCAFDLLELARSAEVEVDLIIAAMLLMLVLLLLLLPFLARWA